MTTQVTLRIDLATGRLGHGKVALLEAIVRQGSIAAGGREFGMSYRRAWLLVDELNRMFGAPLVNTRGGGAGGGGARLSPLGERVVALYREAERKAVLAAQAEIEALADVLER